MMADFEVAGYGVGLLVGGRILKRDVQADGRPFTVCAAHSSRHHRPLLKARRC